MLCQNCGKNEANIRYTQIINGDKKEIALCSKCAKKLGVDELELPINFNSFLGDFFNDYAETEFLPMLQTNELKCKTCGMTYSDFINTGVFGCSDCYEVFSNPIDSLLKNLHGTAKHVGRLPNGKAEKIEIEQPQKENKANSEESDKENKKKNLERDLEKAIKEERYEDAAKIRDEIKEMNK